MYEPTIERKWATLEQSGTIRSDVRLQMTMDHRRLVDCAAVLLEFFELLETHTPDWYTEAHRHRAAAVIGNLLPNPEVH
jgi:hypothetical protein